MNYYEILGVDKNVAESDLKKAYRKLSLKYHPDRQTDKSEEEKKEAEEKFKNVQEAYDILSNPEKKEYYDTFGSLDGFGNGGFHGAGGFDFGDPFSAFREFFTGSRNSHQQRNFKEPGDDVRMKIPYSLADFLKGKKLNVKYKQKQRCPVCHGKGGTNVEVCPDCNGSGVQIHVQRNGWSVVQEQRPCQTCSGTGQIIKDKCPRCSGSGFELKEKTLELDIPSAMTTNEYICINGGGHESKEIGGENGDFYAIIDLQYDTEKYHIEGRHIIESIDIPYYDALLGTEMEIELPDGTKKDIIINECTPNGKIFKLSNYGIFRNGHRIGDYYIQINHIYPKKLSKTEIKYLQNIKSNLEDAIQSIHGEKKEA